MPTPESYCKQIEVIFREECNRRFAGIISFCPWVHPRNAVANCIAFMIDGSLMYKFSLQYDYTLLVAECRDRYWVNMPIQPGDTISFHELAKMIPEAKFYDVFGQAAKDRLTFREYRQNLRAEAKKSLPKVKGKRRLAP